MNNVLYIVPNLSKVTGGPKTRTKLFRIVFETNGDFTVYSKNKIQKSINLKNINLLYIESSTNRITMVDFFALMLLKIKAKKTIVFIRDVYIECFPQEYQSFRGRITYLFNKLSNWFLTMISDKMAFPTLKMGEVFFEKNSWFPKREYFDLPPGTQIPVRNRNLPDFSKKTGILYLGGTEYKKSGFENFVEFSRKYQNKYNFFVLSKSKIPESEKQLITHFCEQDKILSYIEQNNIAYAYHARERNDYDDLTFPIKVLDFVSLTLPFFSENHLPLEKLMGENYKLFVKIINFEEIDKIISSVTVNQYKELASQLIEISKNNTYAERYKKLLIN